MTWISQSSCFSSSKCWDYSCAYHSCPGFITVNLLILARRQNIQDWKMMVWIYRHMLCPLPLSRDSVHWLTGKIDHICLTHCLFIFCLTLFLKQVVNHMQRLSDVVWPSFAPLRSSFFCSNFKTASNEVWWWKFLFQTASNSVEWLCRVYRAPTSVPFIYGSLKPFRVRLSIPKLSSSSQRSSL